MLIVEDQDLMRRTLREYLQSAYADAVILEAADGARALELCRDQRPQLVLMDIGLPDANGIDVTAQIKEMLPSTAVIVASQHDAGAFVERAQAAGACAFITKGEVHRQLLPAIRRALDSAYADH